VRGGARVRFITRRVQFITKAFARRAALLTIRGEAHGPGSTEGGPGPVAEKGVLPSMLEQKHYAFNKPAEREEAPAPDQAASVRLKTLRELAVALVQEIESMKGHGSFEARPTVDFAEEVRRFETDLIRWALMRTGGHQRRAARLLNLKVTTLNAKIKRYRIQPHPTPAGNVVDLYREGQPAE
jgi:DNA-binding protein Fis